MGLFVSRAGSASAKLRGKFVGAPGNTGQADQAAALIRGLQQTEVRRQEEGLALPDALMARLRETERKLRAID